VTVAREGVAHLRRPIPDLGRDHLCTVCGMFARWFADDVDETGHRWCECGARWNALGRDGWQPLTVETARTSDAL